MTKPNKKPIKDCIVSTFSSVELHPDQLAKLRALERVNNDHDVISETPVSGRSATQAHVVIEAQPLLPRWSWLVSVWAVLFTAVVMWNNFSDSKAQRSYQSIAEEVVNSHLKLKPLDVINMDFKQVSGFFSKVDFLPIQSIGFPSEGKMLMGGRYCSIQSVSAAQLRFNTEHGVATLYQAPFNVARHYHAPDILQGEPPVILLERGLKVSIWKEKGLLLVSVEPE